MTEEEHNEENEEQEQQKALLTLAIELGDKKKQLLNIYIDSKPEQLAYDFCLQNNLDFDSMQNLTEEIKNALSNYKKEPNQKLKNQISEKAEQTASNKNLQKNNNIAEMENNEKKEKEEIEHEEIKENNEYKNMGFEQNEENKENESGPKNEELSEEKHEKEENQNEYHENKSIENEHENESEHEIEKEEHLEEKYNSRDNKNDNKEANQLNNEKKDIQLNNNQNDNNKKEENEEELAKEEEGDEMMDINENEEENNVPSYLSPTICFQYKQRQIAQPKPKEELVEFDTTYKIKDKTKELVTELNEEVVNHLNINKNNQKYLPKDYYDNPEGKNFGERLYQRELRLKEEAMEKIRNKLEKENKIKEETLTFIPKINDYNIDALQNRKNNKKQYNDENRILHYKEYLKTKELNTKGKFIEEWSKENTFMPKINKKSERILSGKTSQVPRYELLYKKRVDLKKLEDKIYDENMFKPKINKNYKGVKSQNTNLDDYASLTLEERQKKFKEKLEEKKGKLIEQKNNNIDTKTGKKLFKPTINKNKKLDDERKNKPIFNELYSDSEKYKIKKEELEKKVFELEQFNTEFKASVRSEEIYDKQKNIAFEKIFKRLDNDKDGKISKNDIDFNGITKRILKIISPIMDELKRGKGQITSEEFIKKCDKIYENLNYADKKVLFIYSMGGAIKSVYDTEPFRRNNQRKSRGKSLKSNGETNNGNNEKNIKNLKQSHVKH